MTSKRAAVEEPSGRDRKRQKIKDARTIPVQKNADAGPSTVPVVATGKRLPDALDVEKFAEARAFEISAMHSSMEAASGSASHRVWQTLPRHLRRRAASHDVRRMPIRLREKARQEMVGTILKRKPLARFRSKQGKAKSLPRTESLLKRQKDKTWLETHIWHSKRMHMKDMWGHRLAVTPTEKAFRPSHRASVHGSIIHDASYIATYQLQGPKELLCDILAVFSDPQDPSPGAGRYNSGSRTSETHIYEPEKYPFGLIGPATILWRPQQDVPVDQGKKGKGKARESDPEPLNPVVWIRVHPSISEAVFEVVQTAISLALAKARAAIPEGSNLDDLSIELEDLSGQINAFEIMGPKSSQVLKGALTPLSQDKREDFRKFWDSLTDLQSTGSIPRNMVIGFKVLDPRLKFPPKNAKPHITNATRPIQPSANLAQTELWDATIRTSIQKPRYKKQQLDDRRSQNLIPGTPLEVLRQDDRVPLLLIQRSTERSSSSALALHGWTLLLPAGWSMAFWSSLVFTGTRVAGQRERQVQAFEAGTGYFPHDYPLCPMYEVVSNEKAEEERARWERTPPAKRHNYKASGTRSPWRADWEVVLGIAAVANDGGLVPTQREPNAVQIEPWLLRGRKVAKLVDNLAVLAGADRGIDTALISAQLQKELGTLRDARGYAEPLEASAEALFQGTLVRVDIAPCGRGNFARLAVIYFVEDEEVGMWREQTSDEDEDAPQLGAVRPRQEDIIGYVTSSNFSLTQGSGFALGAVSLTSFLRLKAQAARLNSRDMLVKVRDRDGQICRSAHVQLLDSTT
ncbi:hypothetical protein MKEN_00890800 [Mycena kentingensis (nom. inval.)]|nr:hypothetical protein MKEN_00890800 [Mycena kentingensis (nom. inval.)]